MALLANVALTNTFDTWRTRTNQLVTRINQFAIDETSLFATTLTANTAFTAKGTATVTGLLTASGRATVGTNLTVSGNTTLGASGKTIGLTGSLTHTGTANVSGWFGVAGRATVSTNLFVGANTITMGSVGIGTSSLNNQLSVYGGSTNPTISTLGAGSMALTSLPSAFGVTGRLFFGTQPSSVGMFASIAGNYDTYSTGSGGSLLFGTSPGTGTSGIVERMRIASSGLVTACNSMTVTQNLTVSGNTYVMGNMGVGTSSPTTKLTVVSAINGGIAVTDGTVNTIIYSSTGGVSSIGTTTNHQVQLYTNNAARVTIDTSGLVTACNSMTVTKNLTVSGNTQISGTKIDGAATFSVWSSATSLTAGYTGTGASSTTNISSAALTGAFTKTVNIGTGGTTGSTTAINIGSSTSSTTTINGTLVASAPAGSLTGSSLAAGVTGSSLTSVGTISSGTWNGSSIATTYTAAKVTDVQAGTGVGVSATTGSVTVSIGQSVATSANFQINSLGVNTAGSGTAGEIRATNNITAYYSDARLKDFQGTIPNALDKVLALNGYYFVENDKAKELGYDNPERQVGVSAQEVMAVLPEIVTDAPINGNFEGADYKTVYYDKLVPLLIEAIKELKAEINQLKGK